MEERVNYNGISRVFLLCLTFFMTFGILFSVSGADHAFAKEDENKKDSDTNWNIFSAKESSYASKVFDDEEKNGTVLYFKSDLKGYEGSTVEGKAGKEYAVFLKTLHDWNLYSSDSTTQGMVISIITFMIRGVYAGFLLMLMGCISALNKILAFFADMFSYMNIFEYLAPDADAIASDSFMAIFNPIIDVMKNLSALAKMFIVMGFGVLIFMAATGMGRASRNRGSYLGKGLFRIAMQFAAVIVLPLALGAWLGMLGSAVKEAADDGFFESGMNKIVNGRIIDQSAWIHASLTDESNKDNLAVYLGYGSGLFPKNKTELKEMAPTPEMITTINSYGRKKAPSGLKLLKKWGSGSTMTVSDIESIYGLASKDNNGAGDRKRSYQFKLDLQDDRVRVFEGKGKMDVTNVNDLGEVSFKTVTVAGPGAFGVFLNSIIMGFDVICTAIVTVTLAFAIASSLFKSISLLIANMTIAMMFSLQGLAGVMVVLVSLTTSIMSALFLIGLYPNMSQALDDQITTMLSGMAGTGYSVLITTYFTQLIFKAILVYSIIKGRKAIITAFEGFFTSILKRVGFAGGRAEMAARGMASADREGFASPHGQGEMMKSMGSGAATFGRGMRDGFNDSEKDLKFADKLKNAGKGGLKAAGAGALGSVAGSLKDSYETAQRSGDVPMGTWLAGKLGQGLEKFGADNDDALDNLDQAQELMDDQKDLVDDVDKAQNNLIALKEKREDRAGAGASDAELAAIDQEIEAAEADLTSAERALDQSKGDLKDSAAFAVGSNGSIEQSMQAESMEEAQKDLNQERANYEAAQSKLRDLEDERERKELAGYSPEELEAIDDQIREQQAAVTFAERGMQAAQERLDTGVIDNDAVRDMQRDVTASEIAQQNAVAELKTMEENGTLTGADEQHTRQFASDVATDLGVQEQSIGADHDENKAQLDAMEFIQNNGTHDYTGVGTSAVQDAHSGINSQIAEEEHKLEAMRVDGAPASEIRDQENTVSMLQETSDRIGGAASGIADNSITKSQIAEMEASNGAIEERLEDATGKLQSLRNAGASSEKITQQESVVGNLQTAATAGAATLAAMKSGAFKAQAFTPEMKSTLDSTKGLVQQDLKGATGNEKKGLQSQMKDISQLQNDITSGSVTDSTVQTMERIQSAAEKTLNSKQETLRNLEQRKAEGGAVSQADINTAKQNIQSAESAVVQLSKVAEGVDAHRRTGGQVSEGAVEKARQAVQSSGSNLAAVKQKREAAEGIASGTAKLNSANLASLGSGGVILMKNAERALKQTEEKHERNVKHMKSLEEAQRNGRSISPTELRKARLAVEASQGSVNKAKETYTGIRNKTRRVGEAHRAHEKTLGEQTGKIEALGKQMDLRKEKVDNVIARGGYTSQTLDKASQNIADRRALVQKQKETYNKSADGKPVKEFNRAKERKMEKNQMKRRKRFARRQRNDQ